MNTRNCRAVSSCLILVLASAAANEAASQTATSTSDVALDTITVTASKLRVLEQFTPTGSRLGLSALETPATLDVIDADQIIGRGYTSVVEAADSLPGVTSGGSPGNPAQLSMRGFTGDQITVLHNGLYTGPSNMTNRPQNTFNLASVEILKGPASVLYGQGAIGGVINIVSKGPSFGPSELEFLASSGRFGSSNIGAGGSTALSDTVAIRGDVSHYSTDGYVANSPADSTQATVSLLWKITPELELQAYFDYLEDNPSAYFGTPLVPAASVNRRLGGVIESSTGLALDKSMRYVNYNVADAEVSSEQFWPQVLLKWQPNANLTLQNFAYYFDADRRWINAESYIFNPSTQRIDRDRFFVLHDQQLYGDQGSMTYRGQLAGRPNTVVVGFDYSHLDFVRSRGFPDGDSVDRYTPSPGLFGPLVERISPTKWDDLAVYFEDAIDLTPALKLITGGRYDQLELDRENYNVDGSFNAASSFERTYHSTTWRAGLVYKWTETLTPYISWTTGENPVGSNIFLVNAGENFALSESRQYEIGIKGAAASGKADFTLALYDIERKNILTQTALDTVSNIGSQKSRGVEASANIEWVQDWTVSANASYNDSEYGYFIDTNTGLDASGNRPTNIPKWTANLWTSVRNIAGVPLEAGGGVRYVGERLGNVANTLRLQAYSLVDVYASYRLSSSLLITARANNVFDQAYAQWADVFYPSQVVLGEPRTYEIGLVGKFK